MKKNQDPPGRRPSDRRAADLRRRAEERLQTRQQAPQSAIRNPQSSRRLVHELQVHRIELEMQNEELQQARAQVEALLTEERQQAEKRVRMFSQEIIAAREEERKKVASVLHHDVGSLAVGISAHLDVIEEHIRSGKPGEALKLMRRTRKLFYESVARLKGLAVELRPPELDVIGLRAALRQYLCAAPRHGGARIHFKESLGRRQVPEGPATILFRVAQEALTNAIAHGRAQQVDVDLRASKAAVTLTIHDNGKEFDPSEQMARPTSQMGLRVMREMALSAGGAFTVDSGRGKGTTVRVRLPIAECGLRNADCGLAEIPQSSIRNPQSHESAIA